MNENAKENAVLQWHPGFYAGLQIELAEEAHHLSFENEHQLGTKPKEIDVLVIKKDSNVAIKKNIGRIFRKHNIIEYKSPEDYLSIDDFYKVYGYACFYKADVKKVNEIKVKEITISFVTKRYPGKVMKHLEKERNLKVQRVEKGIYYVDVGGNCFPIQFVVTSQLTESENLWLYNLTNDIRQVDRVDRLLKEYREHQNENLHKSVLNLIVSANKEIFEEANGSMCEALYELFKDQINIKVEEEVKERVEQQVKEQVEQQVKEQVKQKIEEVQKMMISLVEDGLLSVKDAAKRLSLSEQELLEKMN